MIGKLERTQCVVLVEQLWGDCHRDGEVRAELVVCPFTLGGGAVDILVDSPPVDQLWVDVVLQIFTGVWRSISLQSTYDENEDDHAYRSEHSNTSQRRIG